MASTKNSSPWNPIEPVQVTPIEYEQQVAAWLQQTDGAFRSFRVEHQARIQGSSGEYAFDAIAEFEALGGAKFLVLVECKRHADPVKRDDVITIEGKLQDVGAQKAMLFSTSGFQRGALEYAAKRGIATVTFIDGRSTYITRSADKPPEPPAWLNLPKYSGWHLALKDGTVHSSLVSSEHLESFEEWVSGGLRGSV